MFVGIFEYGMKIIFEYFLLKNLAFFSDQIFFDYFSDLVMKWKKKKKLVISLNYIETPLIHVPDVG